MAVFVAVFVAVFCVLVGLGAQKDGIGIQQRDVVLHKSHVKGVPDRQPPHMGVSRFCKLCDLFYPCGCHQGMDQNL